MDLLFVQFSLQEIRSSVKYIIILLIYSFCCEKKFEYLEFRYID